MATAQQEIAVTNAPCTQSDPNAKTGYCAFTIGGFEFFRDEYFTTIRYPKGVHVMNADHFLKNLMRDVAWGFFYGWINFDEAFGTCNEYGTVEMYVGAYNGVYKDAGTDYTERFDSEQLMACFKAMLLDWCNEEFDPFAAPLETGSAFGPKNGSNPDAVSRVREIAERMVGLPGDAPIRTDERGLTINRQFADVPQDEPELHPEPGFEADLGAFNLFAYLSRSPVTWNPSVCSTVLNSAYCPTSEEHMLPCFHGNDRVEWFIQLTDQIIWDVQDKDTAAPRAKVTMKAGDVSIMPGDIRHRGFSPKRSMLLVWENMTPGLEKRYGSGELPPCPVEF